MTSLSRPSLTILIVTQGEPHAWKFLAAADDLATQLGCSCVVAIDQNRVHWIAESAMQSGGWAATRFVYVTSNGYIESCLDAALVNCASDYILRLDDDETLSPRAQSWLADGGYAGADHWKFDRAHLWQDTTHYIPAAPLWPDHQTRLSVRAKAGGRPNIHDGSPFGGGELAPGAIEHHKFLVRDRADRRAIMDRYDRIRDGAGTAFLPFHLPEVYWADGVPVAPWEDR